MSAITNNSVQVKESFIQKYPLVSFFLLVFDIQAWRTMRTPAPIA